MSSAVTSRTSLTLTSLFLGFVLFAPTAFMQAGGTECDQDGDGYVALTQSMLEVVVADNTFKANGNFAPEQWQNIFSAYKNKITADPALDASYRCNSLNFKKGAEPSRCDAVLLDPAGGVFDTSKVSSVAGNKVNPGAFDVPANGIDENCDGADGAVATATGVGAERARPLAPRHASGIGGVPDRARLRRASPLKTCRNERQARTLLFSILKPRSTRRRVYA